jgi:hypothetical protein
VTGTELPPGADAFAGQLSSPGRVFDVRPRAGRADAVPGRPARPGGPAVPCVMLLSRSCDAGLRPVRQLLARAGIRSARVNADELAGTSLLVDPGNGTVSLNGRWLAPTVTWVRHFAARAAGVAGGPAYDMFQRDSWQETAGQLEAISGTAIRPPRAGVIAQLLLARRHGVAVPQTIVTTDLSRARDAFRCPRLVIKSAGGHFVETVPGRLTGVFPVIADRCALPAVPCHGPPVIVQEYVEHEAEMRVYYVSGQVLGFEVAKAGPASVWTDPAHVTARPAPLAPALAVATRTLAAAMSLRYGAFDFLIRDGLPVFLEVNPEGDWQWAESPAGAAPVTVAVARMLAALHRQDRRPPPSLAGRARSFSLLAFLSGGASHEAG